MFTEMRMVLPAILLIFLPNAVQSQIDCMALAESGDCTFYTECVQAKVDCDDEVGYPMAYAYPYCNKLDELQSTFSSEGQEWIGGVKSCLMRALLGAINRPSISCAQLTDIAFDSHLECYLNTEPGFSVVGPNHMHELCDVYEDNTHFLLHWKQGWKQVMKTVQSVYRQQGSGSNIDSMADAARDCAQTRLGSFERDEFSTSRRRRRRSVSESDVQEYMEDGECDFWEALEDKFSCRASHGMGLGYSLLMPMCSKFNIYRLIGPSQGAGEWMRDTQQCLMAAAWPYYQASSIDCLELDSTLMSSVVDCMLSAGFCSLGYDDEFFLDRGMDANGFPSRFPKEYTTRPLSGIIEFVDVDYFHGVKWFKKLMADAHLQCYQDGLRPMETLYEVLYSNTEGAMLRFRTDL